MSTHLWVWTQLNEVMSNAVKAGYTKIRLPNGHYMMTDKEGKEVLRAMKGRSNYLVTHKFINVKIT